MSHEADLVGSSESKQCLYALVFGSGIRLRISKSGNEEKSLCDEFELLLPVRTVNIFVFL